MHEILFFPAVQIKRMIVLFAGNTGNKEFSSDFRERQFPDRSQRQIRNFHCGIFRFFELLSRRIIFRMSAVEHYGQIRFNGIRPDPSANVICCLKMRRPHVICPAGINDAFRKRFTFCIVLPQMEYRAEGLSGK